MQTLKADAGLLIRAGHPVRQFVYVAGAVLPDGTGQFEPFEVVETSEDIETRTRGGDYALSVERAEPARPVETSFEPSTLSVGGSELPRPFGLFLPYDESVTRIVLRRGSEVLAERRSAPDRPQVELRALDGGPMVGRHVVSWSASDPGGAALTFSVWYSPDLGERWVPLAVGLRSASLEVDFDLLPRSDGLLLRVLASNGLNTSEARSTGLRLGPPP